MKKALLFAAIVAVLGAWGGCIRFSENEESTDPTEVSTNPKEVSTDPNEASTGPRVAYSSVGDPNPWFLAFSDELEKEAKKRGYQFRVTHAQAKLEKQISDVEDIVAQKPDFLILGPL